jgi:hypothetical protein
MGLDPQKAFTEGNEARDVQDGVGIQIVKLNPVSKKKTSEERMWGKRKLPGKECEEEYPESWRRPGCYLCTGGNNFRRIILQQANLLGARQLLVTDLGLDLVSNNGLVCIGGLGFLCGGTTGGVGHG